MPEHGQVTCPHWMPTTRPRCLQRETDPAQGECLEVSGPPSEQRACWAPHSRGDALHQQQCPPPARAPSVQADVHTDTCPHVHAGMYTYVHTCVLRYTHMHSEVHTDVHRHAHKHTCMQTMRIHVCMQTCTYRHAHKHTCRHVHTCAHMHTQMYTHALGGTHRYVHRRVHKHTCTDMQTYTHMHRHRCAHSCIYFNTHMHTDVHTQPWFPDTAVLPTASQRHRGHVRP